MNRKQHMAPKTIYQTYGSSMGVLGIFYDGEIDQQPLKMGTPGIGRLDLGDLSKKNVLVVWGPLDSNKRRVIT